MESNDWIYIHTYVKKRPCAILKCYHFTSITYIHVVNTLKLLNIKQRILPNSMVFIQKMRTGLFYRADTYICMYIIRMYVRPQQTRNKVMMRTPLFHKGLILCNMISNEIKNEVNLKSFGTKL